MNNLILVSIIILFFSRFFTEQIDKTFNTPFSSLITMSYIAIGIVLSLKFISNRPSKTGFALTISFLFLLSSSIISSLASDFLGFEIYSKQILKYTSYISIFFIMVSVVNSTYRLRLFINAIIIGTSITATAAIIQWPLGIGHSDIGTPRPFGFSSHPALLSMLIFICLSTVMVYKLSGCNKVDKKYFYMFVVVSLTAILLTQARTTWAALFITVLFYLIGAKKFKLIVYTSLALLLISPLLMDRISDLSSLYIFIESKEYLNPRYYDVIDSSFHWRIIHWYRLINVAEESMWLGWGPGTTLYLNAFGKEAHSSFIEIYVEQGYLGLFCYLFLLTNIAIYVKKSVRDKEMKIRFLVYGEFCGILLASTFGQGIFNETHVMQMLFFQLVMIRYISKIRVEND